MTNSIQGILAYRTYLGLSLHFRRGSYDGWQYNFNGKVKPETFEANRGTMHRYASLESKYPNKNDQLRFMYPAFHKFGFVKPSDIGSFNREYVSFKNQILNLVTTHYPIELKAVADKVSSIHELLGLYDQLPILYHYYTEKLISYDSLVVLAITIPEILDIKSEEPFLWNALVEKLKFDSKFYELYFTDETKSVKLMKQETFNILKDAWNS